MAFILQEPGKAKLLDAIAHCSRDADSGGGVFAFASRGGIEALFALPGILHMLRNGRVVRLVVGMDAITNRSATSSARSSRSGCSSTRAATSGWSCAASRICRTMSPPTTVNLPMGEP